MKKFYIVLIATISLVFVGALLTGAGDYQGSESCADCHKGKLGSFPGFDKLYQTLHTKIHEHPRPDNMLGDYTKEVSMGAGFANAKVGFRVDNGKYYVIMKPITGNPIEYELIYTYGIGWKQRYLVKIEDGYYMPPVQWNLNGYMDNSSGTWVSYNPANWWNADGSLKPINNAFRTKSWDKNCAGCHSVPGTKQDPVKKMVNGNDTSWVFKWANNNSITNMSIGCESCHGFPKSAAGKGHVNNFKDFSYDRKLEVCGQCHTRGTSNKGSYEYPVDENTGIYYPVGEDLMNYYILKPGLWADKESPRQHHQQWVDFKLTKHYNEKMGITCVTCHDPHQKTEFKHQLNADYRVVEEGKGCISCHKDKSTVTNGINTHTKHPQSASMCVSCHLPKVATTGKGYDISSHLFKVISPEKTITYKDVTTPAKGMPNSCALSCHRNGKGTFGTGSNFGITDANLGDWTEASDLALADSLLKYYKIMFTPSSVEKTNGLVSSNGISKSFPNPFVQNTNIEFEVGYLSDVKIEIFNSNGVLVNVLVNQKMDYGTYKTTWNGTSVEGMMMPSGSYYAIMSINGKNAGSKSIVIAR